MLAWCQCCGHVAHKFPKGPTEKEIKATIEMIEHRSTIESKRSLDPVVDDRHDELLFLAKTSREDLEQKQAFSPPEQDQSDLPHSGREVLSSL